LVELLHEVLLRELVMWNRPSVLIKALECLRDSFRRILNFYMLSKEDFASVCFL
jgi:hypothetical protein